MIVERETKTGWENALLERSEIISLVFQTHELFITEGFTSIQVKNLGDNMVLLSNDDGLEVVEIHREAGEWLSTVFDSLKPWISKEKPCFINAWVRCMGVPLNAWHKECFTRLLA